MNVVSDSLDTPNDKARNGLLEINPRSRGNKNIFVVSLKKMFVLSLYMTQGSTKWITGFWFWYKRDSNVKKESYCCTETYRLDQSSTHPWLE